MRTLLKWSLRLIALLVLAFVGLLAFSTLTDYQPAPESEETLVLNGTAGKIDGDKFTVLIWNVGHALGNITHGYASKYIPGKGNWNGECHCKAAQFLPRRE